MKGQKVLVTFSDNWADEMDIEGSKIMLESKWEEYKKALKERKGRISVGFGTNEDNDYTNGAKLLRAFSAKKITPTEEKVLKKFLGDSWGNCNAFWALEDLEDYDDEDGDGF